MCVIHRPMLEEQALLKEKLKSQPIWKKDKDTTQRRKTQPMVSLKYSLNSKF